MTLTLIILLFVLISIASGFLFGFLRGTKKSLLKIGIAIISIGLSFLLYKNIYNYAITFKVSGNNTLYDLVMGIFPKNYQQYQDILKPLVEAFLVTVSFLVTMIAFLIIGELLYLIIKLILRVFFKFPKKKYFKEKKSRLGGRLLGSLIGIAQGVLVSFFVVSILVGITRQTNEIVKTAEELSNETEDTDINDSKTYKFFVSLKVDEYDDSFINKLYNPYGSKVFTYVSTVKDKDGKETNLEAQIKGFSSLVKLTLELKNLSTDLIPDNNFNIENISIENIDETLNNIIAIQQELDDKSAKVINDAVTTFVEDLTDGQITLKNFDIQEIDLQAERDLLNLASDYQATGELPEIENVFNAVVSSDLILPLVSSTDYTINLNEEQKEEMSFYIETLTDQNKIDMLNKIFGLNNNEEDYNIENSLDSWFTYLHSNCKA